MATERQIAANQKNALKSTGPRTVAGKEEARRNALTHGMAGSGKVLKRSDDRELKKAIVAWREHLQPIDVLEDSLVTRAALADVRLNRCLKKDLADLARRTHRAHRRWDRKRQKALEQALDLLESDPELAITQLEASSSGCAWLIDHWKQLATALAEPGFWDDNQARLAVRMCGKDPETAPMDDSAISRLRLGILAVSPEPDLDKIDAFFEESTADLEPGARIEALSVRLPDPELGRAMLLDIVQDELARLEPLREHLLQDQDEPDRQQAEDIALVDTTLAGARALRYETAHEMSLHRSVNLLIRLRKVESEQQTYDRFTKMGIDQGRRFNGVNWEFVRDEAKAQKREEQEHRDHERIAREAPSTSDQTVPELAGQPSAQERYEAHRRKQAEEQAALDAAPGGSNVPAAVGSSVQSPVRNEANSSDANHQYATVYDDSASGSSSRNSERSRAAKLAGSEARRPEPANSPLDEQTLGPGGLRIEANGSEPKQTT